MSVLSSNAPLFGLWQPQSHLKNLYYGPSCVRKYLVNTLPTTSSRVFIVTGKTIATSTPLLAEVENILGDRLVGSFSKVRQHGPIADIDAVIAQIMPTGATEPTVDTVVSIGGGSPIDSTKTIVHLVKQRTGKTLVHITIPTTLSAAECTAGGGYTDAEGNKKGFMAPEMGVHAIFYDPYFASFTPRSLWLSTGMRALDHAVEGMYHPCATEMPWKAMCGWAVWNLNIELPKAAKYQMDGGNSHTHNNGNNSFVVNGTKQQPDDGASESRTKLQLAAFATSAFKGGNFKPPMGLSHSLGHALGSRHGIPHGYTSCLTLAKVVCMKATKSKNMDVVQQIARLYAWMGGIPTGDARTDALGAGKKIQHLVEDLGLQEYNGKSKLRDWGVCREDVDEIVARALAGNQGGDEVEDVRELVESLR